MRSAFEYDNVLIMDGTTFYEKVRLSTNKCLKNILNVIDASMGEKLDEAQKRVVRKVVLDEVNKLKNLLVYFYDDKNTDKS